jgi:hypothetical protein
MTGFLFHKESDMLAALVGDLWWCSSDTRYVPESTACPLCGKGELP